MSLLYHQIFLGRCLLACNLDGAVAETERELALGGDEAATLKNLVRQHGFKFTRKIQRSWCIGRTAGAARLTLSMLPFEQRHRLVDEWVDAGGGRALDVTSEAAAFLETVARQLTDPSHVLSICRMEQAAYRASAAASCFVAPDPAPLRDPRTRLSRGAASALVRFWSEPRRLFASITSGEALVPPGSEAFPYLFAPGLATLRRPATDAEAKAWDCLAEPACVEGLRRDGVPHGVIAALFSVGAVELA